MILKLLPLLLYFVLKNNNAMMIFQQNRYNENNWYIHWLLKNKKKLLNFDLLFVILSLLGLYNNIFYNIYLIISLILLIVYYKIKSKVKQKKPLVYTNRVKRLIITMSLILFVPLLFLPDEIYFIYFSLLIYLNFILMFVSNIINKPIEKLYNYSYVKKAKTKLTGLKYTEVIGITGSYGKTSSKNILNDILNIKYNAFPTPKNYNTKLGLVMTINNYLDKFNDYFIAEMGALKHGDIQSYCDLVKPKYGILTVIGKAHLETFKTIENIQETKFSLIESLPHDGIGILNADDPLQVNYNLKNNCKIIWIGINSECDIQAKNIKCSKKGMSFEIEFDKKTYLFETKLLGNNNIYNLLAAIALGKELGISIPQLQQAVSGVKAVEHRLELIKRGDINIIDDAYNSNPQGFKMALEVLNMMDGKKIIITPGMIELGEEQYS